MLNFLGVLAGIALWVIPGLLLASQPEVFGKHRYTPLYLKVAVAPALTAGLVAVLSILVPLVGLKWNVQLFLIVVAIPALTWVYGMFKRPRPAASDSQWQPAHYATFIALSALLIIAAVVPIARNLEKLDWPVQAWDGVFHLSAITEIRNTADAWPWTALAGIQGGQGAFYPNAFHLLTALIPLPSAAAYNVSVMFLVAWMPIVVGSLAVSLWRPQNPSVAISTFMGASIVVLLLPGVAYLLGTVLSTAPYLASLVALTGVLAWLAAPFPPSAPRSTYAARLVLGVVALGGAIALHPSAIFNFLVLAGPVLVAWAWKHRYAIWVLAGGFALAVAVTLPQVVQMAGFQRKPANIWRSLGNVLSGNTFTLPTPISMVAGIVCTLMAGYALYRLFQKRDLPAEEANPPKYLQAILVGIALSVVLTVLAGGPNWPGRALTGPWYLQAARIYPLVGIGIAVLIGAAYKFLYTDLESTQMAELELSADDRHLRYALRMGAFLFAPLLLIPAGDAARTLAESVYKPDSIAWGTMLTRPEMEFIREESAKLPADAVILGDPNFGTPYFYSLTNRRVVYPHLGLPTSGDRDYLWNHWKDNPADPRVCKILQELGVTHFYYDGDHAAAGAEFGSKRVHGRQRLGSPDPRLLTLVATSAPGQKLFRLNPC